MATAATAAAHSKCRMVKISKSGQQPRTVTFVRAVKVVRQKWTDSKRRDIVRELYKVSK